MLGSGNIVKYSKKGRYCAVDCLLQVAGYSYTVSISCLPLYQL